ncbi:MAG: pyridoxamine 5'-phosphate oxidase [Myxococcaceae bacterium]|nr:pyridoxamine 5'-phosphate oxidase [Myxococcaceae bacterium]
MRAAFAEPFERFRELFARATAAHPKDPNAVTLATVDEAGRPSARIVLMKGFDEQGFVFFTNYESRKGRELIGQKVCALCFYWHELDAQVRVEGSATKVSAEESDAYFATRARISQLGAWASQQSRPLDARATLEARLAELTKKYEGAAVPRPGHWGGFRLTPSAIELWQAGEFRLHDRFRYERSGDGWAVERLNP